MHQCSLCESSPPERLRGEPPAPASFANRSNVSPEQVEEGWREVYEELKRQDEKMVQEYCGEIDTLLVFVSAVS
jgi:hypothetical protein